MSNQYRNVCDVIVPNDLCIGCGLCAGICPSQVLTMQFNELGAYIPVEKKEGCLPKCNLCLQACPFMNQEDNEDTLADMLYAQIPNIEHTPELGYYLDTYVGYSQVDGHRENGSSGGVATWFLETLLVQDIVDKVVCVEPNPGNSHKLFQFAVLDSVGSLRKASRSCYYPVELSQVIREILSQDGRYVITGVPCFIKGLRLAMRKNRRLRRRIVALVGLVCGQAKTKFFAEYLCAACGGDPADLVDIQFRLKDPNRPASDFAIQFTWRDKDQQVSKKIFWTEGIKDIWVHDCFKPNACNFCDDVFAETADVVFMDAWLPEYSQDYRGHSLVLNRREAFRAIFNEGVLSGMVVLNPIDAALVVQSQKGVLLQKRDFLSYRLHLLEGSRRFTVSRRWGPTIEVNVFERAIIKFKLRIQNKSFSLWRDALDPLQFKKGLRWSFFQVKVLYFLRRFQKVFYPKQVWQALKKRLL